MIEGLMNTRGTSPSTCTTKSRDKTPTWGAARPIPRPPCIASIISCANFAISPSISETGEAFLSQYFVAERKYFHTNI